MSGIKEIVNYTNNMKIKKAFIGGYDKNDVYAKIHDMVDLFEICVREYEAKEKALENEFNQKMKEMDALNEELRVQIQDLTKEQQKKILEQQKMKEAYKNYCADLLQQYSSSLRLLSGEFTRILDNVSNLQKGITEESVFEGLEKAFVIESLPEPEERKEIVEEIFEE